MRKILVTIIFALIATVTVLGQNQCTQTLDNARNLYEAGHFYEIPEVLKECLNKGFTREQKIQAYHLLTMVYLYTDDHSKAEEVYMELLKLDPEYDVENENDKIEIVYLNNKFKTTPIFTLTARAGMNATFPVIINDYDLNQKDPEKYTYKIGYHFGPGIDLSINNKFRVGAELMYRKTSFHYQNLRFEEDYLEVNQVQHWLSLPASVKYIREYKGFFPYIYMGVVYDYLLASNGDFSFRNITEDQGEFSIEDPIRLTNIRRRFNLNVMGGIGMKKRIGYSYVFFELRFIAGLRNIIDPDKRYPLDENSYLYDFEALYRYTYIDDDMRLNNIGFSLGYERPFYKPRKNVRQKNIFKRIFN